MKNTIKVTKVTELVNGSFAHVCPVCGKILSNASERDMMPEFSYCEHEETQPEYELIHDTCFGGGEFTMLRHNTYPRFSADVTESGLLVEADDSWTDRCDAATAAKAMREAQDWLNEHNDD